MPRLLVREQADKDVDQIVEAIADDNLSAAMQFQDRVRETYDRIATWPQIGARIRARDEALRDMRYYPIRGYRNYPCSIFRSKMAPKSFTSFTAPVTSHPLCVAADHANIGL
jgi:plasmid stabilization system protein ParE